MDDNAHICDKDNPDEARNETLSDNLSIVWRSNDHALHIPYKDDSDEARNEKNQVNTAAWLVK